MVKPHSERVRQDLIVKKPRRRGRVGIASTVHPEVKDWLNEMIINHWYLYECQESGVLRIAFHNHNDAMRYKLAWY